MLEQPAFYIATLGCKVNQYESHALREAWLSDGYAEATTPESASLILVNTCAVTAKAVADVRHTVRRLHRSSPDAAILITGCAAEVLADELATLPGVTEVIPQRAKAELISLQGKRSGAQQAKGTTAPFPALQITGYDRSRAVLKIQDGCSHFCTYCIVPLSRGPARSRPAQESLAELERLLEAGFREVGISGINLRQYGRDFSPKEDFWDFLEQVEEQFAPTWQGKMRLRISSLEPGQLNAKALAFFRASRLVAPHLHLSLQSGSPSVLKNMGRGHYDPTSVTGFVNDLRSIWPHFGLGADILTAFPGETDKEFQETYDLCATLPLTYAHVFPYSSRPGTKAALLPGQLAAPIKKERAAILRSLISTKKETFLKSLLALPLVHIAPELPVTIEAPPTTGLPHIRLTGINEYYCDCVFSSPIPQPINQALIPARPTSVKQGLLAVEMLP